LNAKKLSASGLECIFYWPVWERHCNNLRLVLGLGLVRVSSRVRVGIRVKVRVSVMVRVSIRTSWEMNVPVPVSLLPASNLHSSPAPVSSQVSTQYRRSSF